MLVASGTLITIRLRAQEPPQALWLGCREQTGSWGHVFLCSVLITPSPNCPMTMSRPPRKGGKGRSTGLPGFPRPVWASLSMGTDKHVPVDGGDQKAHLQGSQAR